MIYPKKWYIPGSSKSSDIFFVISCFVSYLFAYFINKRYGIDQVFIIPLFVFCLFIYAYGYYVFKNKRLNTENKVFHFGTMPKYTINEKNYKATASVAFIGSTFILLCGLYLLFK